MIRLGVATLAVIAFGSVTPSAPRTDGAPMDVAVRARATHPAGRSPVIVSAAGPTVAVERAIHTVGGRATRVLAGAVAADVPDQALFRLASSPFVSGVSLDRPVRGAGAAAAALSGTRWLVDTLGLDGSGIGVATIDSGVAASHDDLSAARIVDWVDFVGEAESAYDDYGHGTHVAGIIAGTGADSGGTRRGIAPGADLVVLKALDATGTGRTSDVVAALDYAVEHRSRFNIRVINLSVAAGVYESWKTDPLARAARRAVEAGIVVVAAAGNFGKTPLGAPQYGGITSPGNAPWVLTVGATGEAGHRGAASFSSRGPSAFDSTPKPDLLAPGVGVESTTDAGTALFATHAVDRLWGTTRTVSQPYLSLSGTSMSAAIVTGTVALMLQAEPALTPNAVKAILEYTATPSTGDPLTEGAGTLNARGAVALARRFSAPAFEPAAFRRIAGDTRSWGRRIIWGSLDVQGRTLAAGANAWENRVVWGASHTSNGTAISWGTLCAGAGSACATARPEPADRPLTAPSAPADLAMAATLDALVLDSGARPR